MSIKAPENSQVTPFNILIDAGVPDGESLFRPFGTVRVNSVNAINLSDLAWAQVLVVSSRSKVDAELIALAPRLAWVGTASSGFEHLDLHALNERGIPWERAKGANKLAVQDYVVTAIGLWLRANKRHLNSVDIGVIGCGQVGSQLCETLEMLSVNTAVFDPFVSIDKGLKNVRQKSDLDAALTADIVTLHCSLNDSEPTNSTFHLYDQKAVDRLNDNGLLIQTSRGNVMAPQVISKLRRRGCYSAVDVWHDEPNIELDLISDAWLATPHIAGHSRLGRAQMGESILSHFIKWSNTYGSNSQEHLGRPSFNAELEGREEEKTEFKLSVSQVQQIASEIKKYGLPVSLIAEVTSLSERAEDFKRDCLRMKKSAEKADFTNPLSETFLTHRGRTPRCELREVVLVPPAEGRERLTEFSGILNCLGMRLV